MNKIIDVFADIKGLKYTPLLGKKLNILNFQLIDKALQKETAFILKINEKHIAVSWWVSPKRTRSYPYARVYDTLKLEKRATIIPIMKDEGEGGDRDFLQWDTISLMSLLGVYVIISYYSDASKSSRFGNKITDQRFDIDYLRSEIEKLLYYHSDALHWNLSQIDKVGEVGQKALRSYEGISNKLGVKMHSWESAEKRINQLLKGKKTFMRLSRKLAEKAQKRERVTVQPKEHLTGMKATLTIKNYLGGYYYLTCDEVEIHGQYLYLIEGKHTKTSSLPSLEDIKDGLVRMMLFTNLEDVKINAKSYNSTPILKLTTGGEFNINSLKETQRQLFELLKKEAQKNGFKIMINNRFIDI